MKNIITGNDNVSRRNFSYSFRCAFVHSALASGHESARPFWSKPIVIQNTFIKRLLLEVLGNAPSFTKRSNIFGIVTS
jgi:hypothetical protein